MTAALRYEWVRIRTIRSTYWLTGTAFVLGVGISFLAAMGLSFAIDSGDGPPQDELGFLAQAVVSQFAAFTGPYLVGYVLAIIGIFTWGHEYRHGMIRSTLTAVRSRTHVWLAKYLVVGAWVAVTTLAVVAGSSLAGALWLADDGISFFTGGQVLYALRLTLYAVVLTWLAAALTSLVRNQAASLVLLFLWPLVVESVIGILFVAVPALEDYDGFPRFLPFNAGDRLIRVGLDDFEDTFTDQLSAVEGLLVFGGVTAVLLALGFALFRTRDA